MSGPFLVSYVALWVLVGALSVAVYALYHHFGQIYLNSREGRAAQGPDLGSVVQESEYSTTLGDVVRAPADSTPTVLVFSGVDCHACSTVKGDIPAFVKSNGDLTIFVFCGGDVPEVREWAIALRGATVIPDPSYRFAARFNVGITPFAVGISSAHAVMAKGIANDLEDLEYYGEAARKSQSEELNGGPLTTKEVTHEQLASLGSH